MPTNQPAPVISLITPCYKTPLYFLERLAFTLYDCRHKIEWVVVDDFGSSPGVSPFFAHIAGSFPHLKLISHDTNSGISAGYRTGFANSTADYVALVDHDDELNLLAILDFLEKPASDSYDIIYTNERKISTISSEDYFKPRFDVLSAVHYFYCHHITLFRGKIAREIAAKGEAFKFATTTFDIALLYEYLYSSADTPFALPIYQASPTDGVFIRAAPLRV